MAISVVTDFIGDVALQQVSNPANTITSEITRVEKIVLRDLLGDKLYNEADTNGMTDGTPTAAKFTALLEGETYTDNDSLEKIYEGLERMLLYFIYAEYIKIQAQDTIAGMKVMTQNNSKPVNQNKVNLLSRNAYNKGVDLYNSALKYIWVKEETYFTTDIEEWTYKRYEKETSNIIVNTYTVK